MLKFTRQYIELGVHFVTEGSAGGGLNYEVYPKLCSQMVVEIDGIKYFQTVIAVSDEKSNNAEYLLLWGSQSYETTFIRFVVKFGFGIMFQVVKIFEVLGISVKKVEFRKIRLYIYNPPLTSSKIIFGQFQIFPSCRTA